MVPFEELRHFDEEEKVYSSGQTRATLRDAVWAEHMKVLTGEGNDGSLLREKDFIGAPSFSASLVSVLLVVEMVETNG